MTIISKEIIWLMYTMLAFYIVPGIIAGVLFLFPSKRELAAKRQVQRLQQRSLVKI